MQAPNSTPARAAHAAARQGPACRCPTVEVASAAVPQAPTAANTASAETASQIAAGPITRNGRAMRAACSAPNARRATATASGVVAATATTTRPAAGPLASPTRARATKSRSAPGGCPATCTAQWSGWSNGMRSTKPRSVSGTFSTARAVGRYSVLWSRGRLIPPGPSTSA